MKAIVKTVAGPGATMVEVSDPSITNPDQILVKVVATSICGTDYHIYSWDAWSANRVKPPRIMGHEFSGIVEAVGSEVTHFQVGDHVSGESHWVCGMCLQCRSGQAHVCENTRILGVDVDGCFGSHVVVPQTSAWKNDPTLPFEIACIQDPLGNAIHTALSGEIIGKHVAILGCGPIGVFAVAVAKACGAASVVATDTRPFRLDLADKLGADCLINAMEQDVEEVVAARTNSKGVDVVLEMSGSPVAIRQAMRIVRPGGRVSMLGIPSQKVELDMAEDMIFKGLEIHCIVGRRLYQTWDTMRALLSSGQLDVRPAITHTLSMDEYDYGMSLMRDGLCGKVVFKQN